jgi:dolichol kinase
MSKRRQPRLSRIKARIMTIAMAVSGFVIVALIAVLWPIALIFAPPVLAVLWLVGREFDDGFDDL